MPAGWAWSKSYRTCKSCIGIEYCRFGLADSMGLSKRIEKRFRGLDTPGKMKLATAGCPRNCSEAMVKDVGAVAIGDGKWEIYIGGAAGGHVRKGDLLYTVDSEEDVLTITGRFMQDHPRERQIQGADLHIHPSGRTGSDSGGGAGRQRRDRSGAGCGTGKIDRGDLRSVDGTGASKDRESVRGRCGGRRLICNRNVRSVMSSRCRRARVATSTSTAR